MPELAAFGIVVAVVLAAGVALGILVAPAVTRWQDRQEALDDPPDDRDHA